MDPPGDESLRLETVDEARNARIIGQKELGELRRSGAALPMRPDDELRLLHREPERLHLAIDDRAQLTCDADEKAADPVPRLREVPWLIRSPALHGHGARLGRRDNTCQDKHNPAAALTRPDVELVAHGRHRARRHALSTRRVAGRTDDVVTGLLHVEQPDSH